MKNGGEGLDTDYLKKTCPEAWNTKDQRETYARLGFDLTGEAFRLIAEADEPFEPESLPVALDLAFSVARGEAAPVIRVAKHQDAKPRPVGDEAPCGGNADKNTLTGDYLDEHPLRSWDHPDLEPVFAVLGWATSAEIVHALIARGGADETQVTVTATITVDTTLAAGGCTVVCSGRNCGHIFR